MTGRHGGGNRALPRSGKPGRSRGNPRRSTSRWAARLVAGLLLMVVGASGWLLWTGLRARTELSDARQATDQMRVALVGGDPRTAQQALTAVTAHAARAQSLTCDFVWRLAGNLPFVGRTPAAVTKAAAEVNRIAADVLPGLVEVGRAMNPSSLRSGSTIDVTALAIAAPLHTQEAHHGYALLKETP